MKVKVGVIGCGYWGPNLIRNFSKIKECEVTYACDVDKNRLLKIKELWPSIGLTQNYSEILNDKSIDAVVIATPAQTHYAISKDALRKNKHLLIEKPFVTTVQEAEELAKIADEQNKRIMIGYTFLYHPCLPLIKKMVDEGYLGSVYYIYSQRINLGLFQKDINVVWDLAPHDLSIIKYVFGKMPNLTNAVGHSHVINGIEDVAFLNLKNDLLSANIHISWLAPHKVRSFVIVGEEKMLVFDDIKEEKITIHHKKVEKPDYFYSLDEFKFAYKYGKTEVLDFQWKEPLLNQCEDFIDCIINDKEPLSSARYSLDILKVIIAANDSVKENNKWRKINDL